MAWALHPEDQRNQEQKHQRQQTDDSDKRHHHGLAPDEARHGAQRSSGIRYYLRPFMAGSGHEDVLKALEGFNAALRSEPPSELTARLSHQSERLNQAITRYHAEGIRFAAFTLIRMLDKAGPELRQDTHAALQRLRDAIEASGLPH